MKILITGGHVTPALAVIDKLNIYPDLSVVFVGKKYTLDREKTLSMEYQEISKRKIPFIELKTGRLTRIFSFRSLVNLLKFIPGFFTSLQIISKEKPDVILSFGGYLALPICVVAHLKGIPVFTHEQTINPGVANRAIGKFATKVFVAFEETAKNFAKNKTIVSGNPVRDTVSQVISSPFMVNPNKPVIYITGGSLGAHAINKHIKNIYKQLLEKYTLIHQTGDVKEYNDYEILIGLREQLPESLRGDYHIAKNFFESEIGFVYKKANLVISRAGANTFFELITLEKPAILIPLPWSGSGEQQQHARIFKDYGLGEIFQQDDTSENLLKLVEHMMIHLSDHKSKFIHLKKIIKEDAAKTIIETIMEYKK